MAGIGVPCKFMQIPSTCMNHTTRMKLIIQNRKKFAHWTRDTGVQWVGYAYANVGGLHAIPGV